MSPELEQIHFATFGVACPRCGSGVDQWCVNPLTGRQAKVPCLARILLLDQGPVEHRSAA